MTGRQPGHDGGGLGLSPMKPSAKRALLLPAWPERKLYWQVAGFFRPVACNRIQEGLTGGVGPFWPGAAWRRCGGLAVGGWLTNGKRAVGWVYGSGGRPNAATGAIAS